MTGSTTVNSAGWLQRSTPSVRFRRTGPLVAPTGTRTVMYASSGSQSGRIESGWTIVPLKLTRIRSSSAGRP